ncbi:unannotated protein [freshwater metagenome]|uniref:Unannotated protein n=1 Tax=freshwater metagenome TaxID=449393 RepID=A0A6J6QFU7_9ZZZZ
MSQLIEAVEAVLPPGIFSPCQGGQVLGADAEPGEADLLWCGGYLELQSLCPLLPLHETNPGPSHCADLQVHLRPNGGISHVDLEGVELGDAFVRLGDLAAAHRTRALQDLGAEAAREEVARLLRHLFQLATRSPTDVDAS